MRKDKVHRISPLRLGFLFVIFSAIPVKGWCQTSFNESLRKIIQGVLEPLTIKGSDDVNQDCRVTIADVCSFINTKLKQEKKESKKISLIFSQDDATLINTQNIPIKITKAGTDITLTISGIPDVLVDVSGCCDNGRLIVDADTAYTLRLSGLSLRSSYAPAFLSRGRHPLKVEITPYSSNTFVVAANYKTMPEEGNLNGCFHSEGAIHFSGAGHLTVTGSHKHAIYSKKSIEFEDCDIRVDRASSDAIHAGKHVSINNAQLLLDGLGQDGIDAGRYVTVQDSKLTTTITAEAAKGIKCGEHMKVERSTLLMTANGDARNKNGDISYSTLLKADGQITLLNSYINLLHTGKGGKCISCDDDMLISGGEYDLETTGGGEEYLSETGETEYFTSKCIAVDGTLRVESGIINCHSSGLGGKGIVAGECLYIGRGNDEGPLIDVTTSGMCILDNESEDERNGCPKAIKCLGVIYIDSGKITCTTSHSGGEGIETLKSIKINGGSIACNTFDDGINAKNGITVNGGDIYCNSINNDGLDSNGIITINGGTVKAISQHCFNECLDAEQHQIHVNGGTIFGISGSPVRINSTKQPYYSQGLTELWNDWLSCSLKEGALYGLLAPMGKVQMKVTSPFNTSRAYFFVSAPYLSNTMKYTIIEQDDSSVTEIVTFIPSFEILNPNTNLE